MSWNYLIRQFMTASSLMTIYMDLDGLTILMQLAMSLNIMKDTGKMDNGMVWAHLNMVMETK